MTFNKIVLYFVEFSFLTLSISLVLGKSITPSIQAILSTHLEEYEVSDALDGESAVKVGSFRVQQEVDSVVVEVITCLKIINCKEY